MRIAKYIFTSDVVTSENPWQIASRVPNVLYYFLHATFCPWTYNSAKKQLLIAGIVIVFSDLALRRHHSWSVMSRERGAVALWRHIRRLFLHAHIGAIAIFTSE